MAISIQKNTVIRFLRKSERERVERFVVECQTQLRSLGINPRKDGTKPYTGKLPKGSDQVNQAGVLRWIKSVTKEEGLETLLLLHATGKSLL